MLKLDSAVTRVSPLQEQFISLLKLFETITREYPETERQLEVAYKIFLRHVDMLWVELANGFPLGLAALERVCSTNNCSQLYEALLEWAVSTKFSAEGSLIGLLAILARHSLELEKAENLTPNFPQAFHTLQFTILQNTSEFGVYEGRPPQMEAFDPGRMTAQQYKLRCEELIEKHIKVTLDIYDYIGFKSPESYKAGREEEQYRRLALWHMKELSYKKITEISDGPVVDYSQVGKEIRKLLKLMGSKFNDSKKEE